MDMLPLSFVWTVKAFRYWIDNSNIEHFADRVAIAASEYQFEGSRVGQGHGLTADRCSFSETAKT